MFFRYVFIHYVISKTKKLELAVETSSTIHRCKNCLLKTSEIAESFTKTDVSVDVSRSLLAIIQNTQIENDLIMNTDNDVVFTLSTMLTKTKGWTRVRCSHDPCSWVPCSHGPCSRPVNTGEKNEPMFTGRAHKSWTRPVNRVRGPWTRFVWTGLNAVFTWSSKHRAASSTFYGN